ncbi:MAG: hypothetical protein Q7S60_04485 [bacterium]|nr:hypothetical protein [bacterium]
MLKVTFEKPKIGIAQEVQNLFKKETGRKKKEVQKPWTYKERLVVAAILFVTLGLGLYFWYKGQGRLPQFPSFNLGGIGFGETIILEK